MASFIPNNRKKKNRLAKLEDDLRRLIEGGADRPKLLKVAQAIRDGRIRVVRARQYARHPFDDIALYRKDVADIEALKAITAEAVLAEYLHCR
jgi:hypothetical protein